MFLLLAAMLVAGCEKSVMEDVTGEGVTESGKTKKFTFTCKGDFDNPTFTRGYLSTNDEGMTDLWVLDYVNGSLVQQKHQSSSDGDFGMPSMDLAYGTHHVYFVASRGVDAVLSTTSHKITWGNPRDTFWKDYEVEVVATSNGNRAVTLDRVATRLRVTIDDEVPSGIKDVTVTPSKWYYGIDYMSGEATDEKSEARVVNVPSSYVGTSGDLMLSVFGMSGSSEWTADVTVTAHDNDNEVIGSAQISGAPFKRNRSTDYNGSLFRSSSPITLSLNSDWSASYTGNF